MTRHAEIAASADSCANSYPSRLRCRHCRPAGAAHGNHRRLNCRSRSHRRLGAGTAGHGSHGEDAWARAASAASTIGDFILDAYTTALRAGGTRYRDCTSASAIRPDSAAAVGAYIALKRCAPVYASASVAVQLTMQDEHTCQDARIYLGVLGLTATRVSAAEESLRGQADHCLTASRKFARR